MQVGDKVRLLYALGPWGPGQEATVANIDCQGRLQVAFDTPLGFKVVTVYTSYFELVEPGHRGARGGEGNDGGGNGCTRCGKPPHPGFCWL